MQGGGKKSKRVCTRPHGKQNPRWNKSPAAVDWTTYRKEMSDQRKLIHILKENETTTMESLYRDVCVRESVCVCAEMYNRWNLIRSFYPSLEKCRFPFFPPSFTNKEVLQNVFDLNWLNDLCYSSTHDPKRWTSVAHFWSCTVIIYSISEDSGNIPHGGLPVGAQAL